MRERINNLPKKSRRKGDSMEDNAVIFIGDKPVMNAGEYEIASGASMEAIVKELSDGARARLA